MEAEGLSLAARGGLDLAGRGKLSGVLAGCQRVAGAGEGKWLSRYLEVCHEVPGMGKMSVADTGCRELTEGRGNRVGRGRGSELSWTFKE
jgi:hypothetical protein